MLQGPFLHSGEVVRNSDPLTCLVSNLQILKNLQFCLSPDSPHISSVSNHQEGIIILTPSPENSENSDPLTWMQKITLVLKILKKSLKDEIQWPRV